ncbi:IPExxxVDY family protein [Lutibacter sp. B1]|uniref:IPExxxVDY family protein n=1 Tax=Lutibacter sp. B1 TaxID=2725996 RepID=UPI0014571674|nr:IPExxxVDY family protein [Lutibacter sp. B1]NLP57131.1 IPExxxVDY family protein [Lutibacter sp. B1]
MQLLTLDLEDDYSLIGIHSTEEDYRLAYLINKHLKTKFVRFKHHLDFKDSNAEFPMFEYKDDINFINYYLINNKDIQLENDKNNEGLFGGNYSTTYYLIPEKKKVDFFLKIEGCNSQSFSIKLVENLNKINQIITSYSIEPSILKSKNNLIF